MTLLEPPDRERGYTRERIIRALLNHTGEDLTKYRLAQLAEASEPWTRQFTDRLERDGLLDGTSVPDPRQLYERWFDLRIDPNELTVSLQQPEQFLTEPDLEYAVTTYRAENLHQGLLFVSSTDFYVAPDEIDAWLNIVENQGLLGGGNTRLRATDRHVFYNTQAVGDVTTVSIPQLIVDLLDEGGPCEEAAEKLIDRYHGGD